MKTSIELNEKWSPVLDAETLPEITDNHRKFVTATILENTTREMRNDPTSWSSSGILNEAVPTNNISGGNIATFDPVMISLLRRTMPNLMAYDLCGVQPMTGPTGLIFAMRTRYDSQTGAENFYNEVNTVFTGKGDNANTLGHKQVGNVPSPTGTFDVNTYNTGSAMTTALGEGLGSNATWTWPEMGFSIEKVTVAAMTRGLKAEYSPELAQDLKAIHGLDAETELATLLTSETLAEINREIVRTINIVAVQGAATGTTTAGIFDLDTDSNGRWFGEKFKGMMFQIEREQNQIAKETRRGKGNILVCSADVASALQMAGVLTYTPALNSNNLQVDDTGNTFAGVLNNRTKVYIDPYAGGQYMVVGYRGANQYDAGLFYCPYVPLQMFRAVGQDTFNPKIGFKTRYGMVMNPFSKGATASDGSVTANSNVYYRRIAVNNIF